MTWTGWANNSDFNHDIGLIRLNREIARSTGQYWVGVVLDIADGNLNNNDSDGQNVRQILLIK